MNNNPLPKPGSIAAQAAAQRNAHALLRLDHTVRSLATRLGADAQQADDLVLEARSVFTITNAVPLARDPYGEIIHGPTGFPLSPEQWLQQRLSA